MTTQAPFIPETAPFTPAQRAWLNGFLAGLYSSQTGSPAAPAKITANIYFGSESGNGEALAKQLAKAAIMRGFDSRAIGLDKLTLGELAKQTCALIVTSTFGEGEPPENARAFHAELMSSEACRLEKLNYSVLALGDRNYDQFCQCGIEFDLRLEQLGAKRLFQRIDCDVDYEADAEQWMTGVCEVLEAMKNDARPASSHRSEEPSAGLAEADPVYSKKNPFPATLLTNRKLTAAGSDKETRHFELSLAGSGLTYEVGDALGVVPQNCPALVDDLLRALNRDGEEAVPTPEGGEAPLRVALLKHYDITKVPSTLLRAVAERSSDKTLADLLAPAAQEALAHYLWGREVIDLLADFPSASFTPAELVSHLRRLAPRLYSISSSLKAFPEQVHLTVASVRYNAFGRSRKGVCSTYLADRAHGPVPVFVQASHGFRLPPSPDVPIIMVGPGTGVAPFRAFLHERRATEAKGRNWLFFGERSASTDFYYREELESMSSDGLLTRLSTAFSRDQADKIYVQHRMLEQGAELWSWLQDGAHFYVCGDAKRMARDVDLALQAIAETHGGLGAEGAAEFVKTLKLNKRYQRDVY